MNHIDELLTRYLLGDATDEQTRLIETWLRRDPANVARFTRDVAIHQRMREYFGSRGELRDMGLRIDDASITRPRYRLYGSLAACLLIGIALAACLLQSPQSSPRVVASVDAAWASDVPQASLEGEYRLTSGMVRIRFGSGAEAIVSGDATFSIATDRLGLTRGTVLIRCPTERSRELVVHAAGTDVTDLGTEFGVHVGDDGSADVSVIDGRVQLSGRFDAQVAAGRRFDLVTGKLHDRLSVDRWAALGRFDLQRAGRTSDPASLWAAAKLDLLTDPSLLFVTGTRGDLLADLRSLKPLALIDGTDARPTGENRFGASSAASIRDTSSIVREDLEGTYDAITFAAWVRLDDISSESLNHRGLVLSDGWRNPGQVHWQVKGRGFRLSYFDRGDEVDPRFAASPEGLSDAGWHFLVTTARRTPQMTVEHYLDGKMVYARTFEDAAPPLKIGAFSIGGWQTPEAGLSDRVLHGAIDDLMIWSRTLRPEEVARLYEVSKP